MDRLAALPTAELDRLLTETLDACSHRLDVWVTSLATRRLMAQRAASAGGDGVTGLRGRRLCRFVQDLRPAPTPTPAGATATALAADLDARRAKLFPGAPRPTPPLQAPADNGGFIHAPSLVPGGRRRSAAQRLPLATRGGPKTGC